MARTRRELLGGARGDEAILVRLLELQARAGIAYGAALADPLVTGRVARLTGVVDRQDREHFEGLRRALQGYGGYKGVYGGRGDVPGLRAALDRGNRGFAAFALRLEARNVRACYEAIAAIRNVKLLPGVGAIMASEAQHLALWRELLGRDPVPQAFESGARVD